MRIFLDTEFIEDGRTIELISIGMVDERDCALHLCNAECDLSRANEWVSQNVLPHLPPDTGRGFELMGLNGLRVLQGWGTRKEIAEHVLAFVGGETPEFWGYYSDYDWVVLCQLFGAMSALPKGWPMFCLDLKQLIHHSAFLDVALPKRVGPEHNALWDAVWVRLAAHVIKGCLETEHRSWLGLPLPGWRV